MTGEPQWQAVSGGSDNPEDLVRVGLGIRCHQRVTKQEPRNLSSLSERISDWWRIRRGRPARSGSSEQWRRAATATGIRGAPHGRRASGYIGVRTRARCRCRGADSGLRWRRMARRAGRGEQGARRDHQNGSPSHAMTITFPPGIPPLPAHTPTGQDAPGWWPSAGANRLGRQVGRFQMRAPPRQEYGKLSYAGG